MGYMCDFCGDQKSVVYCRSDSASLCLSCDRNVHSANALSRRHSRTLLCERCNTTPALVRCIEEKVSLCPQCDWIGHSRNPPGTSSTHKRQAVNCYSGCPSSAELSTIWPFFSEVSSAGVSAPNERVMSLMTINEGSPEEQEAEGKDNIQDESLADEMAAFHNEDKSNKSMGSSGTPHDNNKLPNAEQSIGTTFAGGSKVFYSGIKGSAFYEDDDFYENFNMDEVDLSIQDYDFVGMGLDDPDLFADDQIDGLFGMDISAADSNCQDTHIVEGSSVGRINVIQPAYSNAASADSIMSCKTEPNLRFTKQGHSSLSFSGLTGESSAGDYQDCGASSMLLMGEPPWGPPCPENSLPSSSRSNAVMRYKEKKKSRKFEKKVRYESRKARADVRRRVKGRFVKAGDAYDYDPLNQTRSY